MAIPIEGYSVVAQKARIAFLLESHAFDIPNSTALGDNDIWRCCFMTQTDAVEFIRLLEKLNLNASQGPDSDVVLVNEIDQSVTPYCEWLAITKWEKAVIAWKAGTRPESVTAHQGWDPKVGSGFYFHDGNAHDNLEFLRLQDNIEVYMNKETGKEMYIGRTSTPVEAMFKTASQMIGRHFVTAGEKPVLGKSAEDVASAVRMLEKVLASVPDFWNALWFLGKGQMALGNLELAYQSFLRAYELEKNVEAIPRELAGVCLELGKFDEAVKVSEYAASLKPDDAGVLGNLALVYLLAGRIDESQMSITAAIKITKNDKINNYLSQVIHEIADGKRPRPQSLAAFLSVQSKPKRKFWEFWKKG
jgi:tetratricopeptide (TPR) repeat protein